MMRNGFLILLLTTATPAPAQDLSGFEKILLPAHTSSTVEGVNGSTFRTVLSGYSDVDITIFAVDQDGPQFGTQRAFDPTSWWQALNYGPARPTGRFLYIEADKVEELSLQFILRSSDAREETADQMTALPIVREPRSKRARILSIPVEPIIKYEEGTLGGSLAGYRHRVLLRVYDWDGDGTSRVLVKPFVEGFFGEKGGLKTTPLTLDRRDGDDPTFPWYAELPLDHCLPMSLHTPCMEFSMRVEIEPLSEGLRFWPFVSVTDNRTQHVTIFEPQP